MFEMLDWVNLRIPQDASMIQKKRGVAQPGSALAWGASGRRFKSGRPELVIASGTHSVVSTIRMLETGRSWFAL